MAGQRREDKGPGGGKRKASSCGPSKFPSVKLSYIKGIYALFAHYANIPCNSPNKILGNKSHF